MEDKRNRSDEQQSGSQPREQRQRDRRRSGGSMESPGNQRSPREDEEQPQE